MFSSCGFSNMWFEINTNKNPVGLTNNSNNLADIKTSGTNQWDICRIGSYLVCVVFYP